MISIMHSYAVVGVFLLWYVSLAFGGSLNASTLQALHVVNGARYESFLGNDLFTCFKRDGGRASDRIVANTKESLPDMRAMLPQLANQTILFVGDSAIRNQYVALSALVWEADDSCIRSLIDAFQYIHCSRWNLTVALLWSTHILEIENRDLAGDLSRKDLHANLTSQLSGEFEYPFGYQIPTVLFLSTGHHWTHGRHVKGIHDVDVDVLRVGVDRINRLLKRFSNRTRIVWRGIPARHYEYGNLNTGGSCNRTLPYSAKELTQQVAYEADSVPLQAIRESTVIREAAKVSRYEYVDILPYSIPRADGLVGKLHRTAENTDCTHYCIPGVPDVWNGIFLYHISRAPDYQVELLHQNRDDKLGDWQEEPTMDASFFLLFLLFFVVLLLVVLAASKKYCKLPAVFTYRNDNPQFSRSVEV